MLYGPGPALFVFGFFLMPSVLLSITIIRLVKSEGFSVSTAITGSLAGIAMLTSCLALLNTLGVPIQGI